MTRDEILAAVAAKTNLRGADLRGAYLSEADLRGADLRGADLRGAYLSEADLDEGKISRLGARVTRNDGYEFFLWLLESGGHIIKAGCQSRTIASYREHVAADYPNTARARETTAILDYLEVRLNAQD